MKRIIIGALALVLVFSGCSKGGGSDQSKDKQLTVWSFTDELETMINKHFLPSHPDWKITYSMTITDQFTNKLDPVLASGQGAPDVFALEDAFVRKYVESGLLLDLTDIANEIRGKSVEYPIDVGTYNGRVYGLSWQVTPGAMFYRRSLARKYLGTDDPAIVQQYVSNLDKFVETAALLKDKSKGACVIVASTGDMFMPYKGARAEPWVVDGKLVIDPAMDKYLDMVKLLKDKGYEGRANQWSEGWYAGMKGELKDEAGKPVEVFSYLLPTWGMHYVLKTNAPDTSGDWAMIPGPAPYRWGGTWLGIWKGTKHAEAAKEFVKYLTSDDAFLETWALETGDVVSNNNVLNKIKDNYTEPFLNGQNHYAEFTTMAQNIDGSLTQGSDQAIEVLFNEAANAYSNGEKTKAQALKEFKDQVSVTLGF